MAAEEGLVIVCHTVDAWKLQFDKAKDSGKPIVVCFSASWCGPCRIMSPIFAEVAKKMTDIIFVKVDVDEVEPVAEEYNVYAVPTSILIKEGKVIHRFEGPGKEKLQGAIEKYFGINCRCLKP